MLLTGTMMVEYIAWPLMKLLCDEHTWTVSVWVRPLADLDDELEHAYEKADLFEKIFKRKLQLLIQDQE